MKISTYKIWLLCLFVTPAKAIDIGALTTVIESQQDFLSQSITNNTGSVKIYTLAVSKWSNPTAAGQLLVPPPGELLYAPKRFVLRPGQQQNIKFYYRGEQDSMERYYRVTFTESPAAQPGDHLNVPRKSALEMKFELQSHLVVRPRQENMAFQVDKAASTIRNTGNSYFEVMVKEGCDQPDSEADSKYLLPGELYFNPKIGNGNNKKFIVYKSGFIPIEKECWSN